MFAAILAILMLAFISGGCAKYEYNLVRPPEQARHIGTSVDAVVTLEPLEYRMRSFDNRLVIRIYNGTQDAIGLLGTKSAVVDPEGQSHPIRGQTIVPGSYIKLILPPIKPEYYDPYGPYFGFGASAYHRVEAYPYPRYGYWPYGFYRYGYDPYFYDPYEFDPPRYFVMMADGDAYYWDWKGEGECRLMLVYSRAGKEFTQEFLFSRQKM
jgi:hypothetical protein